MDPTIFVELVKTCLLQRNDVQKVPWDCGYPDFLLKTATIFFQLLAGLKIFSSFFDQVKGLLDNNYKLPEALEKQLGKMKSLCFRSAMIEGSMDSLPKGTITPEQRAFLRTWLVCVGQTCRFLHLLLSDELKMRAFGVSAWFSRVNKSKLRVKRKAIRRYRITHARGFIYLPSWELSCPLLFGTFESMIFLFPFGGIC